MLKAIIFDMDGVLVDSEYTFLNSKTEILRDAGYDVDISYQYQFMGTTFEYMWTKMKDELKLPLPIEHYIEEMNKRRHEMLKKDGVNPIKGAIALVKRLYENGYPLAVASSSPKREIIHNIEQLQLTPYFQALVSGEECARSKPFPDVFIKAAEFLGVTPENCLVFEDTKNGSLAAKNAGMQCIGFENPDYPAQDLSRADLIVQRFDDVSPEICRKLFTSLK